MDRQKEKINWKELSNNQLLCTIIGWVLGIVSTVGFSYLTDNPILHDYISIDSVSYLAEVYLVDTGFVDAAVLDEESLDKQFQLISDSFVCYESAVEDALVGLGESKEDVSKMVRGVLLNKLPDLAEGLANKCAQKDAQIERQNSSITALEKEKKDLQTQIDRYQQRKEAEMLEAYLIVDGETKNNGDLVKNAVAIVDGNNYFSQSFLNLYVIPEQIRYDSKENSVVLGCAKPIKVKFDWEGMVSDSRGVSVYTMGEGKSFDMAKDSYSEGIVLSEEDYLYVQLRGKYSKMTFTYGHVDNTEQSDLEIKILALDENGETYTNLLKTISLKGEMNPKHIEIPLGYVNAIKIVVSNGSSSPRFGLTDIYFYS